MLEPTYTPESMLDALLDRHQQIAIVVMPGACSGLEGYPAEVPLRLNVGHSLQPPMAIRTAPDALTFWASFGGTSTKVRIPWGALMFAGTEAALLKALEGTKPEPPAGTGGDVIRVDFAKGRRA